MEELSAFRDQVCSMEQKKDDHNKDRTNPIQDKSFKKCVNSINRMKTCQYHQNFGNTIEKCVALRDKIENLIQKGALANYIYTPNNNRSGYHGHDRG